MPSTPSPLLKLEEQASGEHNDTWGDNLNATLVMIENAIAKRQPFTLTGGTTTLTDTQYVDNQARSLAIDVDGTLTSNAIIVVPSRSKMYIVRNVTTGAFTLTVKTSAGTGTVVTQGGVNILWCDGTNVVGASTDASTFGGLAPSAYARLAFNNTFTKGNADLPIILPDGATITIDSDAGNVFRTTLAGDRTIAISNEADGRWVEFYVTQDGTGGRTLTWPANIVWQGGAAPSLSTAANTIDLIRMRYFATGAVWIATIERNFNTGGGSTISQITVSGGSSNVDLFALAGSPAGPITFNATIDEGTLLQSTTTGTPALDLDGFAGGSVIALTISGIVHGKGGKGGNGGGAAGLSGNDPYGEQGRAGRAGGDAIRLPSTACTISINITTTGRIWGGGGGGGGGGGTSSTNADNIAVGGGGAGGAGGGQGGEGMSIRSNTGANAATAANGTDASVGRSGVAGAAGAGAQAGTATGGAGGAGGTFGVAGSVGVSPTGQTLDSAGGALGAAGKAINYNGGSTPTYPGNTGSPYILGATA